MYVTLYTDMVSGMCGKVKVFETLTIFCLNFDSGLIDCYLQGWRDDIMSNDRYSFCSSFRQVHNLPKCLAVLKNTK